MCVGGGDSLVTGMPDHGERHAEEIQRTLEREVENASYGHLPSPDYDSNPLESSHTLGGGRKVNGGIMVLANYKSPTVNIRVQKWSDNVFWIKAENFEAAQYIADAVFHHTGRHPFHFRDAGFRYPPLCLGNGELLTTREKFQAYVAKIAKGSALRGERGDYKTRVKKLVLEAVKSPEAVRFLKNLRAIPRQVPHLDDPQDDDDNVALAANREEDLTRAVTDDGGEENGPHMEVDSLSEQAMQSLAPTAAMDPACVFHIAGSFAMDMDIDVSTAFVPGFGMYLDESENILQSEGLCIRSGCHRFSEKEKVDPVPSEYKDFVETLDKQEEEAFKSIKRSDLEPFCPRLSMSYYRSHLF